jgi:hypothetical protein
MIRLILRNNKEYISVHTNINISREGKPDINVPVIMQSNVTKLTDQERIIVYKCISGVFDKPFKFDNRPKKEKSWFQKLFGR